MFRWMSCERWVWLGLLSSIAAAQQAPPVVNREATVTPVPFERILRANQEPQNWLTYSGTTMSQRHSLLNQITPENAKDLRVLRDLIESGKVTPVIDRTYPLSQTPAAIRHVQDGRARGKVVITI